ncbi:hypothetical protein ACTOB_004498 [Actinoplanes oblitus]|uniref:DUF3040 domain-containing protein n=1 Tax=Actinoplanes oblitus TaxID=3040509 RepID=A0ABY8W3W0_9ACTN|nr:hypothetical protein [Actinoplanes oblitus]WIM92554.1 hypothetical protein ACTOB_004498 [Actinoplanes oblitus]
MASTGSDVDAIGELRGRIDRARAEMASLNPRSPRYRQLRRDVVRASGRLRDQQVRAERRAGHVRDLRLLYLVASAVCAVAGWAGTWLFFLAAGLLLVLAWFVGRLPEHAYR